MDWPKFSQQIKYLLFHFLYKMFDHCKVNIDFIASAYAVFDSPSYVDKTKRKKTTVGLNFQLH